MDHDQQDVQAGAVPNVQPVPPQPQPAQLQPAPQPQPQPAPQPQADVLSQNFRELQYELRLQSLASQVQSFSGQNSRDLRIWIRDMTKIGLTVGNSDEKLKILALQTLKGPAAEYYSRLIRQTPQITWANVLQALRTRFSDYTDQQFALHNLKRIKQNTKESVQNYAERIIDLAEEAFGTIDLSPPLIQQQLRDIFLDGIQDDNVARKIIRNRPATLDAALNIAVQEQLTLQTFNLRRREEMPMEVDALNAQATSALMTGAVGELKDMITEVLAIHKSQVSQSKQTKANTKQNKQEGTYNGKPFAFTGQGTPICAHCDKVGHRYRQCRKRKQEMENQANKNAQGN